jgi:hypothetical protein
MKGDLEEKGQEKQKGLTALLVNLLPHNKSRRFITMD